MFRSIVRSDRWQNLKDQISPWLPEANFITIHYAYFIFTSLITAVIFWGSSSPRNVSFTDALFLTASAMTEAGLNTVNLSQLNTFQQTLLFVLIMMGSAIFVSAFIVLVRKNAFEKQFSVAIGRLQQAREGGSNLKNLEPLPSFKRSPPLADAEKAEGSGTFESEVSRTRSMPSIHEDHEFDSQVDYSRDWAPSRVLPSIDTQQADINATTSHNQEETNTQASLQSPISPIGRPVSFQLPESHRVPEPGMKRANTMRFRGTQVMPQNPLQRMLTFKGVGSTPYASLRSSSAISPSNSLQNIRPRRASTRASASIPGTSHRATDPWFESKSGWITRNSQFNGLDHEERQKLGGVEYKAILFLSFLVPIYFFVWQFLGALSLGAWVANHRASTTLENGINPWWVGAFNAVSAFNNSGMSLLDANMTAFSDSIFMLLSMGLFILAGNTAYPIFLRLAIWTLWKVLPDKGPDSLKATLLFLLKHPRRCYTNLFPALHTWWLGLVLLVLNGVDWAAFEVLNIGNHQITSRPAGLEVVDGLFQALAVRAGGFYVVPIPTLRISLQVLYVIMMYISAYPVVITMRNSNVYEERSLGIFADETPDPDGEAEDLPPNLPGSGLKRRLTGLVQRTSDKSEERSYFVRQQVRAQLAHDAWWIVLAIFLIMIVEADQFEAHPVIFSVFNVIFEVVSGYACVGMSIGVPYAAYSFCGSWRTLSKLVLICVMIRGRHRGLPVAIDRAVQLPSQLLGDAEEEDGVRRAQMARANTFIHA